MQEQIEFIIPDGYIKDEENTTDKKVVYKLEKKSSIVKNWDKVCNVMFSIGYEIPYLNAFGFIDTEVVDAFTNNKNNLTSIQQGEKLMAINQLLTVAKYLNSLVNFENIEGHFAIIIESNGNITTGAVRDCDFVYFKGLEAAKMAIEILGEDIIKLALTANNY